MEQFGSFMLIWITPSRERAEPESVRSAPVRGRECVFYMPFRIKADGKMLIVAIDSDTISKGGSSACNGKSISSGCKGGIIVDMPCPFFGCRPFILYDSICTISSKIIDNCLPLGFHRQFFSYASLKSSSN